MPNILREASIIELAVNHHIVQMPAMAGGDVRELGEINWPEGPMRLRMGVSIQEISSDAMSTECMRRREVINYLMHVISNCTLGKIIYLFYELYASL